MKTLKAICTAAILALAFSVPAYAGDVGTPGVISPGDVGTPGITDTPPGNTAPATTSTILGDISSPGFADILMVLVTVF